jgi:hypothetical protein
MVLLGCGDSQPADKAGAEPTAKAGAEKGAPAPDAARPEEKKNDKSDAPAKPEAPAPVPGGEVAPTPAAGGEPTAALAAGNEPKIEVLSTGSEPRQPLRFAPSAGQVDVMKMVMNMTISIDMGGMALPAQTTPPITMYNTSTVETVAAGQITQKVVFDRYEMGDAGPESAMMVAAMGKAFDQMKGFEQRMVYDARGAVLSGDLSLPPGMDPQMAQSLESVNQSLEQAMLRLPEEAVGVGAKWKEVSTIKNNGLEIEQTAEYTAEAIDGNKVSVTSVITQAPKTKTIEVPNMPGATVDLIEFDSKGSGKIELELDHMIPLSGQSTMDTSLTIEADAGGQKQKIKTTIKLDLQITRE